MPPVRVVGSLEVTPPPAGAPAEELKQWDDAAGVKVFFCDSSQASCVKISELRHAGGSSETSKAADSFHPVSNLLCLSWNTSFGIPAHCQDLSDVCPVT